MKKAISLLLLVSFCGAAAHAVEPSAITTSQARALVMASLTAEQRRLPKLEVYPYAALYGPSKFLFFTVIWEGLPKGSVVVGNYAVDPHTADVFSAVASCYEEHTKTLRALQRQIRVSLHLSLSEYKQLKTTGPLCEE